MTETPDQQPQPSAALAHTARPEFAQVDLSGRVQNLDQAMAYAKVLAASGLIPPDLRGKPADVLMVMLYGQYLDIPVVVALQVISPVNGRPMLSGKFLLARLRDQGHRMSVVESTEERCTVKITRGDTGEEHAETFTLAKAAAAGLVEIKNGKPYARSKSGKPLPWETWTDRLLLWRAVGHAVDVICPEVKMGLAVEGEAPPAEQDGPSLADVAAERADRQQAAPVEDVAEAELVDTTAADEARAEADRAAVADIAAQHAPDPAPEVPWDPEAEHLAYEAAMAAEADR